ncbi:MAG: NCS2 family permease, partial [Acidobacteriota bacterium]|nr:NCS2 family permease [Acidobacteriota bacterium]
AALSRRLGVEAAGSTLRREALGGLTTFLTMAYIVAVNPIFLTAAGMPLEGAVLATCLSAAFATLLMGWVANYPIALAPGMGLNAFFAYSVCLGAGVPWQTALGLVFWAGVLFVGLTVSGARKRLVRAVPKVLRLSGAVGIGLFIAFIGLQQGTLVQADANTMVTLGDLTAAPAVLTLVALALAAGLAAAGISTAIFWGLLFALVAALVLGMVPWPESFFSLPSGDLPGLQIDLLGALQLRYLPLILVILFFDLFDTLGTLLGVAYEADLLDEEGELPGIDRALTADSVGSAAGALFGTSTVTSFIESGAGVAVGARTGVANFVTAGLFLLAPFATPLVAVVGQGTGGGANPITAPALILVGSMMVRAVREIDWRDTTEALPAFLTAVLMPLSFNITHGLAAGIVAFALVKTAAGRRQEVPWLIYLLAVLIILRYALLPL